MIQLTDHAGGLAVEQNLVRFVHRLQTTVVKQARFLEQPDGVRAHRPRRVAITNGTPSPLLLQKIHGLRNHPPLIDGIVERHRVLVDPSVNGDLVMLSLANLLDHLGMHHRGDRRDVKRDGNVVLVEQLQHSRHALERAVLTE